MMSMITKAVPLTDISTMPVIPIMVVMILLQQRSLVMNSAACFASRPAKQALAIFGLGVFCKVTSL